MQSKEKRYFNITLNEEGIVSFDTNIKNSGILLQVIASVNAATIDIVNRATGRDDTAEILVKETLDALEEIVNKGGVANENSK
jgi:hypothetical protein